VIERLEIPAAILGELTAHARSGAPLEVCGLLAGREGRVERSYPLTNAAAREDFFALDPLEQMAAYRAMREADRECLAVYHSHPATPARPSAEDIANANDPEVAYVIVSLSGPEPNIRAFHIRDDTSHELTIHETTDEDTED